MEEKKEILVLPFGRKIQVGNYTVLKYTKTLTKQQLKSIREDKDIHPEVKRQLTRNGLPYIKVEAISMIWPCLQLRRNVSPSMRVWPTSHICSVCG